MKYYISQLRRARHIFLERRKLKSKISGTKKLKIHIGTGKKSFNGWIDLNLPYFDLREERLWNYFFSARQIDNILMEHVLEHLTVEEVKLSLSLAKKHLTNTGRIRIAVPDKNHPNPKYIEHVRPNGIGPGAYDHKSFWNFSEFKAMCMSVQLDCVPIEYYDEEKVLFMKSGKDDSYGVIHRTAKNKHSVQFPDYSSLIVDIIPFRK